MKERRGFGDEMLSNKVLARSPRDIELHSSVVAQASAWICIERIVSNTLLYHRQLREIVTVLLFASTKTLMRADHDRSRICVT